LPAEAFWTQSVWGKSEDLVSNTRRRENQDRGCSRWGICQQAKKENEEFCKGCDWKDK